MKEKIKASVDRVNVNMSVEVRLNNLGKNTARSMPAIKKRQIAATGLLSIL